MKTFRYIPIGSHPVKPMWFDWDLVKACEKWVTVNAGGFVYAWTKRPVLDGDGWRGEFGGFTDVRGIGTYCDEDNAVIPVLMLERSLLDATSDLPEESTNKVLLFNEVTWQIPSHGSQPESPKEITESDLLETLADPSRPLRDVVAEAACYSSTSGVHHTHRIRLRYAMMLRGLDILDINRVVKVYDGVTKELHTLNCIKPKGD